MGKLEYAYSWLIAILALLVSINVGSILTFFLFLTISSTLIISLIYPLIIRKYIEIERFSIQSTNIYKGQSFKVKIYIKNNSSLPIILLKIKTNDKHLEQKESTIFYIESKKIKEHTLELKATKRGFIDNLEILININLFFDLLPSIKKNINTSFYIYPNFSAINYTNILPSQDTNLGLMYKLTEEGEFFAIRDYQFDDIKKISWKHWAKTGKLVVKQKAQYTTPKLFFIIFNLSTEESKDEELVEKINTFFKYLLSQNIEIYATTLEKQDEYQHITNLKNSLVFLSQLEFLKNKEILSNIKKINENNTFFIFNKDLNLNLDIPKISF